MVTPVKVSRVVILVVFRKKHICLRWEQISLEDFEESSILFSDTPPPPQWQHAWAHGSGSWKLWGASPGSSNRSGGCPGRQTDKPRRAHSGDLSIWFCPEKATSNNMNIDNQINPIGLAIVQSSIACAGTQWNTPVLSYFISVFSNTRLRTRASSGVGDSFLLSWSGVRFIWNSFRLKLPVVRTATSTTGNDTHTLKTISGQRQLTLFAHASGYKSLIFNVFMAALAVKVCPENATRPQIEKFYWIFFLLFFKPLDLLSRLGQEISDGECGGASLTRVDRDLCRVLLFVFHLNCHQQ